MEVEKSDLAKANDLMIAMTALLNGADIPHRVKMLVLARLVDEGTLPKVNGQHPAFDRHEAGAIATSAMCSVLGDAAFGAVACIMWDEKDVTFHSLSRPDVVGEPELRRKAVVGLVEWLGRKGN
jgi:hypothetical protein